MESRIQGQTMLEVNLLDRYQEEKQKENRDNFRKWAKKMSDNSSRTGGLSFFSILGLMFIGLKLTGHIDWSWLWVLLPLWGPLALVMTVVFFAFVGVGIATGYEALRSKWRKRKYRGQTKS